MTSNLFRGGRIASDVLLSVRTVAFLSVAGYAAWTFFSDGSRITLAGSTCAFFAGFLGQSVWTMWQKRWILP